MNGHDGHRHGEIPGRVRPGSFSALLQEIATAPATAAEAWVAGLRAGAVVGRFELVREIGRGGFGVVWEARDRELKRRVAFKAVRAGGRPDARQERLLQEAEAAARLTHPNIVTLYDVGRSEHGPYLVLELLEGKTLAQQLTAGALPVREAVRIGVEIAGGLAHAHANGVVHRDLKPENVFLCHDGQVKVLDFGLAHAFGQRRVDGGTSGYMAPEQVEGSPEDERTDVWALGAILFELLTGGPAFTRDRPAGKAPALEVAGAPALGPFVGRMLAVRPLDRPRDGAEVLAALTALHEELERDGPIGPVRKIRRAQRRLLALAAAGVLLAAAASVGWWLRPHRAAPRAHAIAVLPFANLSATADNDYFSDGLAEEILNLLTRVRELKVAASASSFSFKDSQVGVAEVAKRLRVDVVLVGTVRRDHERLRVGAELVDGHSGFRLWSHIYDRRLEDVFSIQDDVARQVVGALEIVLSRASENGLSKPTTENIAAYDPYLRGRGVLRQPMTPARLEEARSLFQQAIDADPDFAQAHAGLCDTWLARYELSHAVESFEQAERACHTALEHDRDSVEVYVALGNLHRSSGKYQDAERELEHASTLASSVDALLGLARTHAAQHHLAEAEAVFRRAKRLDPDDWRVDQQLANFLYQNGRYLEAARSYGEVIQRTPDNASARSNLGAAYYMAGELDKAAEAWRASLAVAPTTGAYSNVGSSYFYLGRFDDAAAMYLKALSLAPDDHRLWGNLGDAQTYAPGQERAAAAAYAKAIALGERALQINPSDAEIVAELAHYHAGLGHLERARRLRADALKRDPRNVTVQYKAALVSVRLHETEAALDALEHAVELGYQRELLPVDAGLASLRGEARFQALLGPQGK